MPRARKPPAPPPRYAVRIRSDCSGIAQAVRLRSHTTRDAAALDAASSDHFELLDWLTGQRWSLPPQGPGGRRTGRGSPCLTFGGELRLDEEPPAPAGNAEALEAAIANAIAEAPDATPPTTTSPTRAPT